MVRVSRGFWSLGPLNGAALRIHWTTPLGAFALGRFAWVPGFWLGFVALVLVHEVGHAVVVRAAGHHVVSVDVHGFGGRCRWQGLASPLARACIAWGGVWAQLALLAATEAALLVAGPPQRPFASDLVAAFTTTNLVLMAVNLLPIPALDGAEAWMLPRLLWARRRVHRARAELRRAAFLRRKRAVGDEPVTQDVMQEKEQPLTPEAQEALEQVRAIVRREVDRGRSASSDAASSRRGRGDG